jgi:hypothetical protein
MENTYSDNQTAKNKLALQILPPIFLVVGMGLIILWAWQTYIANQSLHWKQISGVITNSRATKHTSSNSWYYVPEITYDYSVNNRNYHGNNIYSSSVSSDSQNEAEDVANHYPKGSTVVVYYDPMHHDRAVLRPGLQKSSKDYTLLIIGGFMASISLAAIFSKWADKNN